MADDNVDAAETLSFLLHEQGHEVRAAYDGEEAVRISKPFVPDVAIFDLGMSRMDQARTKAAGFDYHSLKPASLEKLNAVLATLIQAQDEKR